MPQIPLEDHYYCDRLGNINGKEEDLKALKQELAELLEEDAKYDKLRSLPLYSCRITGWKFWILKVLPSVKL